MAKPRSAQQGKGQGCVAPRVPCEHSPGHTSSGPVTGNARILSLLVILQTYFYWREEQLHGRLSCCCAKPRVCTWGLQVARHPFPQTGPNAAWARARFLLAVCAGSCWGSQGLLWRRRNVGCKVQIPGLGRALEVSLPRFSPRVEKPFPSTLALKVTPRM